jgi:hypothetical protein
VFTSRDGVYFLKRLFCIVDGCCGGFFYIIRGCRFKIYFLVKRRNKRVFDFCSLRKTMITGNTKKNEEATGKTPLFKLRISIAICLKQN